MNCPGCGHPIQICHDRDGKPVPLETYPELSGGRRWTVVEFRRPDEGKPHVVAPVTPGANVSAYVDHRVECRHWEDGRAGRLRA